MHSMYFYAVSHCAKQVFDITSEDEVLTEFRRSCKHGHLKVAQTIHDLFVLNREDIILNNVVESVCENRRLKIMKWICGTFALKRKNVLPPDHYAFQWICEGGHLRVAQWLHKTFALTREEVTAESNIAFRWACLDGHLEVAQWLHETFALTREDMTANGNCAFRWACEEGYLKTAQWIHETCKLTCGEAITFKRGTFRRILNYRPNVAQWLLETFKINPLAECATDRGSMSSEDFIFC